MGVGTAQDGGMGHSSQREIIDEFGATRDQPGIFYAVDLLPTNRVAVVGISSGTLGISIAIVSLFHNPAIMHRHDCPPTCDPGSWWPPVAPIA